MAKKRTPGKRTRGPAKRDVADGRGRAERRLAQQLEAEVAVGLAVLEDVTFPLVTGNLKEFPRPSPENDAAEAGIAFLRKSAEGAVAALYLIAAAREQKLEIPAGLRAAVDPYIAALKPKT